MRFNDSAGYMTVNFMHPDMRTWPVPLAYSLLHNDQNRVIAQAIVGCVTWVLFAHLATRNSRYPAALRAAVLAVGLAPQVTRFDSAILSESFAISASVLLAATLIGAARSRNWRVPAVVAWILFVFIRPENLLVGVIAGCLVLVSVIVKRRTPSIAMAVVLFVGLGSIQQLRSITTVRNLNMYSVLAARIMTDSERYAWFVEHGMPNIPGIRYVEGYDYAPSIPQELRDYLGIPVEQDVPSIVTAGGMELARWVRTDAWSTYARRLVARPRETFDFVSSYAGPSLNARSHTFLPTENRRIVPDWVFGTWQWWAVSASAGLLALIVLSRTRDLFAVGVIAATTIILFPLVTVASGIEQQRHAAVVAVMLRLVALAALTLGSTTSPTVASDDEVR